MQSNSGPRTGRRRKYDHDHADFTTPRATRSSMWDADKSSDVDMEAEQAKVPNGSEQAKNQSEPNKERSGESRKDLGRRGSTGYRYGER